MSMHVLVSVSFFFFNDTATTEIYTLSLHDALPICHRRSGRPSPGAPGCVVSRQRTGRAARAGAVGVRVHGRGGDQRSEEHTSELQSRQYLVCRLLLEKKKKRRKRSRPACAPA